MDEMEVQDDSMERIAEAPNQQLVALPQSGQRVFVPLVQPRTEEEGRMVISARQTDKINADDLVALATQLTGARDLVKGRACDRLRDIARQMEQLHMAARAVLEDARRDEELHQVPCNMQKQAGRVYHLFQKKNTGERYFSMIAPHEWGNQEKLEEYTASYRLEYDRSWTPINELVQRDEEVERMRRILQRDGSSMLTWGS